MPALKNKKEKKAIGKKKGKKGTKKPKSDLSSEVSQENILEDKYKNIPYWMKYHKYTAHNH